VRPIVAPLAASEGLGRFWPLLLVPLLVLGLLLVRKRGPKRMQERSAQLPRQFGAA